VFVIEQTGRAVPSFMHDRGVVDDVHVIMNLINLSIGTSIKKAISIHDGYCYAALPLEWIAISK
jgi:hypothetical protein